MSQGWAKTWNVYSKSLMPCDFTESSYSKQFTRKKS
jgi:hypothetical protein